MHRHQDSIARIQNILPLRAKTMELDRLRSSSKAVKDHRLRLIEKMMNPRIKPQAICSIRIALAQGLCIARGLAELLIARRKSLVSSRASSMRTIITTRIWQVTLQAIGALHSSLDKRTNSRPLLFNRWQSTANRPSNSSRASFRQRMLPQIIIQLVLENLRETPLLLNSLPNDNRMSPLRLTL